MNISIVYATNSGSTLLVAQRMQEVCQQAGHEVVLLDAHTLTPEQLVDSDAVVFGTPSYDARDLEGQPHDAFEDFFAKNPDWRCDGMQIALFGLGDRSYQHFCGGVSVLREWLTARGASIQGEPLFIDSFYYQDPEVSLSQAGDWILATLGAFTSSIANGAL